MGSRRDDDDEPVYELVRPGTGVLIRCPHCDYKGVPVLIGTRFSWQGIVVALVLLLFVVGILFAWIPLSCTRWRVFSCGECSARLTYTTPSNSNLSAGAIAAVVFLEVALMFGLVAAVLLRMH
jgi:hypothetical protein